MENYFAVTLLNPLISQWHMSVYNTVRIYGVTGAYWTVAYLGLFLLFIICQFQTHNKGSIFHIAKFLEIHLSTIYYSRDQGRYSFR